MDASTMFCEEKAPIVKTFEASQLIFQLMELRIKA